MAKKKVENESKITNDKLFEGLVCLDIKLDKLISIFEKVAEHIERKEKGEISPFRGG